MTRATGSHSVGRRVECLSRTRRVAGTISGYPSRSESSMALRLATAICVAHVAITYVTQLARFSPPLPVMSSRHLRRELVMA